MGTYAIRADRFFLSGAPVNGGFLVVSDGLFVGWQAEKPDCEVRNYAGSWVAPGLVDTHIHGMLDHDVMDCEWEGVNAISRGLLEHGVTSWTPTTLTAPFDEIERACAAIGDNFEQCEGARVQGIFLEGPFFTEKHKGAQNPKYLAEPSIEALERWQRAAHGLVCKCAVAPEYAGAVDFTSEAVSRDVVVALGHSDATYAQAVACVDAGATEFVHTYNGMSPLHHREPGMVGAAFTTRNTYAEAICDGHHLNPFAVKALIAAKGYEHVVLVTDCLRCGCMPNGHYHLGELPIVVEDGAARLEGAGNLAGSMLTLDQAVRNVVDWGLVSAEQAIYMATEAPARANGIDDVCGSIKNGRDADFIVLDHDLNLRETYLGGISVYQA